MQDRPQALMIFAAGRGTRMAPLTDTSPKPLVQVAGKALIDHALELADGCSPVVVNTHYLADQLHAHLRGRGVTLIHEPELLETGGGLKNAADLLGPGPVLTLNSDAVWRGPNVLRSLVDAWTPRDMDALVSVVDPSRAQGHAGQGDFLLDDASRVSRGPGSVYTGAQIIKLGPILAETETFFSVNRVWDRLMTQGRVTGLAYPGHWCDVGQPSSISLAERMLTGV